LSRYLFDLNALLATFDRRIPAEAVPDGHRHLTVIDA
jgi:hypothetical protein